MDYDKSLVELHLDTVDAETPAVQETSSDITTGVNATEIVDVESRAVMVGFMDAAAKIKAKITAIWEPICSAAHKAHKAATTARADMLKPVEEAEKIAKRKIGAWDTEQERIRREEERKAREEAERKAKEEADRLLKEAEVAKSEEEQNALIEKAAQVEQAPVEIPVYAGPKPSGVTYVDNWKARVIDVSKLAKAFKGEKAPAGVEFYNDRIVRRG